MKHSLDYKFNEGKETINKNNNNSSNNYSIHIVVLSYIHIVLYPYCLISLLLNCRGIGYYLFNCLITDVFAS